MNRQSAVTTEIPKVLMVGPGRDVMGGISTVVNSYYELGLDKQVDLKIHSFHEGWQYHQETTYSNRVLS